MSIWSEIRKHPELIVDTPTKEIGDHKFRMIELTQGQYSIVDASDYEWLMQWKWFARWDPHTKGFYATRNGRKENGESVSIQMHREILGLSLGDKRKSDHANRNTLDNRRLNLRIATNSQNGWNQKCHSNSKTGLKGISFHKTTGLYQAEIRFGGKRIYLGKRATAEQAHELYKQASEELHKEFSRVR